MSLDDLIERASWLSTVAQRAQYVCRDRDGSLYVTDNPPSLTNVVRVLRPT